MYSDVQLREIFHFLYLEQLFSKCDPALFAIKGGVNLRFFLNSPRYSEDLDLDVFGGSVETHKKNGYQILQDQAFLRALATFGISQVLINDKSKAKHTKTTQRFRCRLVNQAGEELPTKVEYSHRASKLDTTIKDLINPEIALKYRRRSFSCPHYSGEIAVLQKVRALGQRAEVQARDLFDLYILFCSGYWPKNGIANLEQVTRGAAQEAAKRIGYESFIGQVVEFLDLEVRNQYESQDQFRTLQDKVIELLNG